MTENKWLMCYGQSFEKIADKLSKFKTSPDNWSYLRPLYDQFLMEVDEATEVYKMENNKCQNKK